MQHKPKPCKGLNIAIGFGCGNMAAYRKYGLCPSCLSDFMFNSNEGKSLLNKTTQAAKRAVERQKRSELHNRKATAKNRAEYARILQTEINAIVRLIDTDKGCISCAHGWGSPWTRQRHAGHRLSVGSDATLRYHLDNIYVQCSICNNHLSGNPREYDKGLLRHYGQDALNKIESLKLSYPSLHLDTSELQDIIRTARQIQRNIIKGECYNRDRVNRELGIYT